jgi:HD-GYP domain-containing protein (c-di-GMP phosphodiesterase class II)
VREYLRQMRDDTMGRYLWRRLQRAVQSLQGLTARSGRQLLALTLVKDVDDDYTFVHSANTCVLTLLLCQRLGLPRPMVINAGMAALLHHLGPFRTPPAATQKAKEARTPAEAQSYGDHPYRAFGAFLETRRLDEQTLTVAVSCFEYEADEEHPVTSRPIEEVHPIARIVSLCEAYDELTTRRPWRPATLPDRAIAELISGDERSFDDDLLALFAAVLGIFPPGSAVQLETGELGFVAHPNPDDPQRPLVALVRDAAGKALDGDIVDLATASATGRYRWSIAKTVNPVRLGLAMPEYLSNG